MRSAEREVSEATFVPDRRGAERVESRRVVKAYTGQLVLTCLLEGGRSCMRRLAARGVMLVRGRRRTLRSAILGRFLVRCVARSITIASRDR